MKRNVKKHINKLTFIVAASFSSHLYASDFNLPFVNTSGLGNMYAGWAASADDASTLATNPAGLTMISSHEQFVGSAVGLTGKTRFNGSANTVPSLAPNLTGHATSDLGGLLPGLYYSIPYQHKAVFAFGVNIPFALGTNYAKDSIVRYAATRSQVVVMDFMPGVGFHISDKLSAGISLDIERLSFTLNRMYGFPLATPDAEGQNHQRGWGYGFHAGLLYELTPATRFGLNYNSQVAFRTTGDSIAFTSVAEFRTTNQKAAARLPALAQFSAQHNINDRFTVMGTIFYTGWSTFQFLTLQNTMLPLGFTTPVPIPFQYHNTLDYAVGLTYHVNEKWALKAGSMFLNTPSNNRDRSLPDPVGAMKIFAIGAHYQRNKTFGYDFGYAHSFFRQTAINHFSSLEFASGHSNQYTNILGAQITWNIC